MSGTADSSRRSGESAVLCCPECASRRRAPCPTLGCQHSTAGGRPLCRSFAWTGFPAAPSSRSASSPNSRPVSSRGSPTAGLRRSTSSSRRWAGRAGGGRNGTLLCDAYEYERRERWEPIPGGRPGREVVPRCSTARVVLRTRLAARNRDSRGSEPAFGRQPPRSRVPPLFDTADDPLTAVTSASLVVVHSRDRLRDG